MRVITRPPFQLIVDRHRKDFDFQAQNLTAKSAQKSSKLSAGGHCSRHECVFCIKGHRRAARPRQCSANNFSAAFRKDPAAAPPYPHCLAPRLCGAPLCHRTLSIAGPTKLGGPGRHAIVCRLPPSPLANLLSTTRASLLQEGVAGARAEFRGAVDTLRH